MFMRQRNSASTAFYPLSAPPMDALALSSTEKAAVRELQLPRVNIKISTAALWNCI